MHAKITHIGFDTKTKSKVKDNSNISKNLLETIERYYNSSMATDERIIFEEKIQNNPEFKIQVEDIKTLLLGIETQALKEQLDEFHKGISKIETPSKVRFLNFRKLTAAAAIIIAIGSFWIFNKPENEKLYAKYFKPDPGLPTVMGTSENFDFYDAMVNYKHGDYDVAIEKWSILQSKKPKNDTINYFLGSAHLANENESQAISFFNKTITSSKSVFLNDTYYYLGLAYLKEGNIRLAKKNFDLSNTEKGKEILLKFSD